ncbi:calpain-2 catalytic subunit-like, partial [Notothenia coriiceps]|uniref:Calpain-2 catalytic subunit-like n=1 Tax=Notothenia coriiceps TaxID=8208 RepID=A0A6I9NRH9_9TELE
VKVCFLTNLPPDKLHQFLLYLSLPLPEQFWQYGEWVEVVVDDRLPVREGRLLFSYSHTRNEYWSALVEKAYAKLVGSYGSLKGGNISEGMEDFTGGIAYSLQVSSCTPRVLWRSLTAALSRGSLLSCFIQASSYLEIGKVTGNGLIKGHAYAITDTDKASMTQFSAKTSKQRHFIF